MRSLAFSMILIAAVAGDASAQASRITAPIQKARAAAAASNARLDTQQSAGETTPPRDSVNRAAGTAASAATPAVATPAAATPAVSAPSKPAAPAAAASSPEAAPAPAKPATASSKPAAPPVKPVPAAVTPAPATPAPASDKNTTAAPPQATGKTPVPNGAKGSAPVAAPVTTPGKDVTPAPAKPSPVVEAAPSDTVATVSIGSRTPRDISISREVFTYDAAGRRDPFVSLLNTADLRPLLTDLVLVSIIHDAKGGNSVAILRDAKTKDQYRVRPGQLIGRMRVTAIELKRVLFTIDEFGFSRQETLVFSDSTNVRKQ